jgi:MoxR-like ATPase
MLAIEMRFRCGIPVVIMGETGCGKTRLIRYMCDLKAELNKLMERDNPVERENFFILKVHGGILENDIVRFVDKVQSHAEENMKHGLDTIAFFDEANTTDAIGLIKEIMCDRRIQGRRIEEDIKFVASCNPYKKYDGYF